MKKMFKMQDLVALHYWHQLSRLLIKTWLIQLTNFLKKLTKLWLIKRKNLSLIPQKLMNKKKVGKHDLSAYKIKRIKKNKKIQSLLLILMH